VSEATTTELAPGRTEAREAKHWIERQLRWERTLGALRTERTEVAEPQAA
jgi:hypothetical protein